MAAKSKFEKVREYFERGLWDIARVRNAVIKGWITPEEFETITGEKYSLLTLA